MLTGVVGHIKWHTYTAAAIHGYTVSCNKERTVWTLIATVVLSDAFNMDQRPLVFVAKHAKGAWRFPIESWQLVERHHLTARLGPPES